MRPPLQATPESCCLCLNVPTHISVLCLSFAKPLVHSCHNVVLHASASGFSYVDIFQYQAQTGLAVCLPASGSNTGMDCAAHYLDQVSHDLGAFIGENCVRPAVNAVALPFPPQKLQLLHNVAIVPARSSLNDLFSCVTALANFEAQIRKSR